MEYLSANLAGRTRRETLNGLEYVVAPMTLIVSGVLNGSKGPLFYPPEEVERNPSVWNGIPLLVYHPKSGSGRDPEVQNAQGIGYVFRAKAKGGLLTAEGWFDVKAVLRVDNRILQAIQNDKPLELSTGLHTDDEKAVEGANHNGTAYDATARNYRPDHVAILPDMTGACSVADGCGVLNAGKAQLVGSTGVTRKHQHRAYVDEDGYGWADFEQDHSHPVKDFKVKTASRHTHTLDRQSLIDTGVRNVLKPAIDQYLINNKLPLTEEKDMAKLTDEKRTAMVDFIVTNCEQCGEEDREGIAELTDNVLTAWQAEIKSIATTKKDLEAVTNAATKEYTDESGNEHTWNAEKNQWETKLKTPPKKKDDSVQNQDPKPQTKEEWFAAAPPEVQSIVENGVRLQEQAKTKLVERLTANIKDEQVQAKQTDRLMKRSLVDLEADAALLPAQPQRTFPDFTGQASPARQTKNDNHPKFGLPKDYLPQDDK